MSIGIKTDDADFGCEGLLSSKQAREFLGGISYKTLQRLVEAGKILKGRGDGPTYYCRRSVRLYAKSLEL